MYNFKNGLNSKEISLLERSIESYKVNRYERTIDFYTKFCNDNPNSDNIDSYREEIEYSQDCLRVLDNILSKIEWSEK